MASPSFLTSSLLVILGGGFGAWLRFIAARLFPASEFPWSTLTINLVGSLMMGLLAGWLARQSVGAEGLRLLLGVGLLGGFTTFSAFSLEVVGLAQRGAIALAALYAGGSVVLGAVGLFAGLALTRGPA